MSELYELHADEAWTHDGGNSGRYWCFFGGVLGRARDIDRLQSRLRAVRDQHGLKIDKINWKYLDAGNVVAFQAFADAFFMELRTQDLKYRQLFLDRSLVRLDESGRPAPVDRLEIQFKVYYQFLKHSFWLQALPKPTGSSPTTIRVRLDQHSSALHKERLIEFVSALPAAWGRPDVKVEIAFVRAKSSQVMQVCDLLCGAAGSHGNKMHARREPGQRGMKEKQKIRHALARHIYNGLRQLDSSQRGSRAFNWFESTGTDGSLENRFHHKLRVWKFRPARFARDRGWENDHLDKQGRHIAPDLMLPEVSDEGSDWTF